MALLRVSLVLKTCRSTSRETLHEEDALHEDDTLHEDGRRGRGRTPCTRSDTLPDEDTPWHLADTLHEDGHPAWPWLPCTVEFTWMG